MYITYRDGWFDILKACIANPRSCNLQRPMGFSCPEFTGIERIDATVTVLIEFFASGLQSDNGIVDWEAVLGTVYMAAQFGCAWSLMFLEGFRLRNSKSLLGW